MGGLTSLLLLLCVGVTLSAVLDLQKRIIGGHPCKDDERLYHVKLITDDRTKKHMCGGSLISERWILTARHCWEQGRTISADLGVHPDPRQKSTVEIKNDQDHVKIIDKTHDIMLLQLSEPAPSGHIIPLPDCGTGQQPDKDALVQVAGHGPTDESSTPSSILKCANLKKIVYPQDVRSDNINPENNLFCGRMEGGRTNDGDSGGGVVFKGMIYGVHKSTITRPNGQLLSVFMNVCSYKKWIQDITGIQ